MIQDKNLIFSDDQDLTGSVASTGTASTNVYDSGTASVRSKITGTVVYGYAKDWGPGEMLEAVVVVKVAYSAPSTDGSISFIFQGSNTEGSAYVNLSSSPSYTESGGLLAIGYRVGLSIPKSSLIYRYYRFFYMPVTQDVSTLTVDAFLVLDSDQRQAVV